MPEKEIQNVYFIGIGGIGMSAIARFYKTKGKRVCGYDRTPTPLTSSLQDEGIAVHFTEDVKEIPEIFKEEIEHTLVIYTPAIPADHSELQYFRNNGYKLIKRSQALGFLTKGQKTVAVAGTHGKTTTSTLIAHILKQSELGCNAFLGGISKNYQTNLLLDAGSPFVVTEADEFDRSFLQLFPYTAVVTAADADHLDIYGTHEELKKAFCKFINQIQPGGNLVIKKGLDLDLSGKRDINIYTYSLTEKADFTAQNVKIVEGAYEADIILPQGKPIHVRIGIPGLLNVENTIAAVAVAWLLKVDEKHIQQAVESFSGVNRRFDYHLKTDKIIYIDDYGHHPEELRFTISSVRELYPGRKVFGIFQPHLYTRTRDLADDFVRSLNLLDGLVLLPIYPAREKPIPGVTSQMLLDKVSVKEKILCSKEELTNALAKMQFDVLLTMGAGDIDKLVGTVKKCLINKFGLDE